MTLAEFEISLRTFNQYSGVAGILYFIFFFKSQKSLSRIVFLILALSFLADVFTIFFIKYIYPNSFIITNSWYILNFCVVCSLFYSVLPVRRKLIISILAFFLVGSLITFLSTYSYLESNTFVRVSSNVFIIFLSLLSYFELINHPTGRLKNNPLFWLTTALFAHSCLVLLRNLFLQYLVFDLSISKELFDSISIINLLANITKNFILFYALVLLDKGYPNTLKPAKTI